MNTNLILLLQFIADIVLFVAIIVLIVTINRERRKKQLSLDSESLVEFRRLIEESKLSAGNFERILDEGRKALKTATLAAAEREKHLRELVNETDLDHTGGDDRYGEKKEEKYRRVTELQKKGMSAEEIASLLNMPTGEVQLIVGLDRQKIEK